MLGDKKIKHIAIASILTVVTMLSSVEVFANTVTEDNDVSKTTFSSVMLDASSNRYSRLESKDKVDNRHNLEGYIKIMEDGKIEIWHRDKNASIKIVDKETGYIWGGLTEEKPEDMNKVWSAFGNSLLGIDYFDEKGIEKRASIGDSKVKKSYKINKNVLKYSINFSDLGISLEFDIELKDGSLTFKLNNSSIKEEKKFVLANVYFMPFLGSTKGNELDGYMLVPDGPGALIRFNKPSVYSSNFDKKIYGKDYGIDQIGTVSDLKSTRPNDFSKEDPSVLMPIFGVVHGVKQNAVLARVDSGAEYASIMATPSGMVTSYNWISSKFTYRQKYLQPTSRNGAGVQIVQEKRNNFNAEVTFKFLNNEDADYVGMAKKYRDYLREKGILNKKEEKEAQIPLQLDIIGADSEKGFISSNVKEVTSVETIKDMINELSDEGINNISMVIQGWQKGGIGGAKTSQAKFESKFAKKDDIKEIEDLITPKGGKLYYYYNPVTGNKQQLNLREEGSMTLSQALTKITRDSKTLWFTDTHFVQPQLVATYLEEMSQEYKKNSMNGMAIGELGSKLYSEGKTGFVKSREEARIGIEKASEIVNNNTERLALYSANEYLWRYSKEIFNVPMVNSQYIFQTDTIPFLQIVLKGSIDYFSPYSNMSFYSTADILKMVEYGSYPAFLLTGESNSELLFTTNSELYSTKYADWKDNIIRIYNFVNDALHKVKGLTIVDREVLGEGVIRVDYEGSTSIYVNYTDKPYKNNDLVIDPQSYKVIERK